jgi:hypothetical protein
MLLEKRYRICDGGAEPQRGSIVGYYTYYSLTVDKEDLTEVISAIFAADEDKWYALEQEGFKGSWDGVQSCKWYNHEKDMKELSLQFPGALFTLHGEGENTGDLWNLYCQDGRLQEQHAEIVYPPFDPTWGGTVDAPLSPVPAPVPTLSVHDVDFLIGMVEMDREDYREDSGNTDEEQAEAEVRYTRVLAALQHMIGVAL